MNFDPVRFFDVTTRALPPELLELYPDYIDLHRNLPAGYAFIKRAADIVVSALLLILTGLLWVFASAGILISDGPRIFFVQLRVGQNGRLFRLIKFRTLRPALPKGTPTEDIGQRRFAFALSFVEHELTSFFNYYHRRRISQKNGSRFVVYSKSKHISRLADCTSDDGHFA